MKNQLLFLILAGPGFLIADLSAQDALARDSIFIIVEEMPEPINGRPTLYKWLAKSIYIDKELQKQWIESRFIFTFVVEKDGQMSQIKVQNASGEDLTQLIWRPSTQAPQWKPGQHQGMACRVQLRIPLRIHLN
ncbi:MAG: hypothetical protein AAFU64_09390 [Bacteroidota bacterium]